MTKELKIEEHKDFYIAKNKQEKSMEKLGKTVVVYLHTSKTFIFHNVTNLRDPNNKLTFDYFGLSQKVKSHANFVDIAGWSIIGDIK